MEDGTTGNEKIQREIWKGVKGGPVAERRALKEDRDLEVRRLVNRHGVMSADLLAAVLGFPNTPQDVQTAARLMERLSKEGFCQFITQSHIHYGVSFAYSLRKRGAK